MNAAPKQSLSIEKPAVRTRRRPTSAQWETGLEEQGRDQLLAALHAGLPARYSRTIFRDSRWAVMWSGAVAAIALIGLLLHNGRKFGLDSLLTGRNGEIQIAVLLAGLVVFWWRWPAARIVAAAALVGVAVVNMVAGAVGTIVPFGILSFEPEQSLQHYLSHVINGLAQVPLLVLGLRDAGSRRLQRANPGNTDA